METKVGAKVEDGGNGAATEQPVPVDPMVAGAVTEDEANALNNLRRSANSVIMELGQTEVRKARLLGQLGAIEGQAQQTMQEIAKRLGIPDGKPWQVTPDGKARYLGEAPQQGQPPA